ncbi:hypothetical protein EAI_07791 [Harpegnathos saltator]|uniref:Uncharacterized protein n=1 Tax=Harpegnathos saltator TaxID=610380 RepID=E2BHX1_HARSA|nr:hypothetical protein EAI_07791 [Harpegnathos saltator]
MLVRHRRLGDPPPAPTLSDLNWNLSDPATASPPEKRLERSARLPRLDDLLTKEASWRRHDLMHDSSALWDRLETHRGLSWTLRAAEAIFPRDFRETANQSAISQEVPYKPTTGQRVRAFVEWETRLPAQPPLKRKIRLCSSNLEVCE